MRKPEKNAEHEPLCCSFCDASIQTVGLLIRTPSSEKIKAFICEDCVVVCVGILADHVKMDAQAGGNDATESNPAQHPTAE